MTTPPFDPYREWFDIPPQERPVSHYRLLGIPLWEADLSVITAAADKRIAFLKSFQPGPHSNPAQKLKNEVAAAKICLLNPAKKASYDAQLKAIFAAATSRPIGAPAAAPVGQSPPVIKPQAAPEIIAQLPPQSQAAVPVVPTAQTTVVEQPAEPAGFRSLASAIADARSEPAQTRSQNRPRKKSAGRGLGTYSTVVLVIGVIGLAGILWLRANHWVIQLTPEDDVKSTEKREEKARSRKSRPTDKSVANPKASEDDLDDLPPFKLKSPRDVRRESKMGNRRNQTDLPKVDGLLLVSSHYELAVEV